MSNKSAAAVMATAAIAVAITNALISPLCVQTIWNKFVVPLNMGAPELTYWHAFGLSLFGSVFAMYTVVRLPEKRSDADDLVLGLGKLFVYGLVLLFANLAAGMVQ